MSRFSPLTRRQTFLAACGLAFLGLLTILPWQVVAQESNSKTELATKSSVSPGASAVEDGPSKTNPPVELGIATTPSGSSTDATKKMLVGCWRDAAGKEIEFFADGTYEDLGAKICHYNKTEVQDGKNLIRTVHSLRNGGKFVLANGQVQITDDADSAWNARFEFPAPKNSPDYRDYKILRLDESFLRMLGWPSQDPLFFRRVNQQAIETELGELPAELRPLFAAAGLNSADAQALIQIFDQEDIGTSCLKNLRKNHRRAASQNHAEATFWFECGRGGRLQTVITAGWRSASSVVPAGGNRPIIGGRTDCGRKD